MLVPLPPGLRHLGQGKVATQPGWTHDPLPFGATQYSRAQEEDRARARPDPDPEQTHTAAAVLWRCSRLSR